MQVLLNVCSYDMTTQSFLPHLRCRRRRLARRVHHARRIGLRYTDLRANNDGGVGISLITRRTGSRSRLCRYCCGGDSGRIYHHRRHRSSSDGTAIAAVEVDFFCCRISLLRRRRRLLLLRCRRVTTRTGLLFRLFLLLSCRRRRDSLRFQLLLTSVNFCFLPSRTLRALRLRLLDQEIVRRLAQPH